MAKKKSGFKKTILAILITLVSIVVLIGATGLAVYNFVIIPKYNQYITSGEKTGEKLSNKDIIIFAKYLTDKQLITNLTTIDADTAKGLLSAMLELGEEAMEEELLEESPEPSAMPTPDPLFQSLFSSVAETVPMPTPAPTPSPTPFVPPEIPEDVEMTSEQKSAYDRIMAAATKEEIQRGLAIISKIDVTKAIDLNNKGKDEELKAYLKSVLTTKEISASIKLYNKYSHLL